jgi:hypothetical protein
MKRFCYFAVLMVLSSSAYAGDSVSFVVGGHRIRIEAPRYCRSPSCVSVSIPGIYETRRSRDRYDDLDDAPDAAPVKPLAAAPAPAQASAPAIVPPASRAPIQLATTCAPASPATAASTTQAVAAPPPLNVQPSLTPPTTPPTTAPVERPSVATRPAPVATPQVSRVSHGVEDEPTQTPLGDWQTEGKKGSVRIEQCGRALCGYRLNASSNAAGETVLINMKPKAASEWSGNIFSRDSGNTYYATMTMKGPNSLRVEACALGKFFCTGNVWSRVDAQPDKLITSRQISSAPRS